MQKISPLAAALLASAAHAATPPGPPGPAHVWFEAPHGVVRDWCCKVSDGHLPADDDWREAADHYEARIDGVWRAWAACPACC